MSVPEGPAQYPAPPRPSGGGSCWKWGGIACLGCGCAGLIGLAVLSAVLASRPEVRKAYSRMWNTVQEAGTTVQRMQEVGQALEKFAQDQGRYPAKLSELSPRYVAADRLTATPGPDGRPFIYHRPPEDAPSSFRILEVEIPNPVMPTQAPPIWYFYTKGGKIETPSAFQMEYERQPARPGSSPSNPDRQPE